MGLGRMYWIDLAQDSGRRRALVNAAMNIWVPDKPRGLVVRVSNY
jgi:hypothetical protein